jgi:hypothetical protein
MMLPRFALTLSVAIQVLLVFHSSIASLPVVVGAKTTTSIIDKEGEDTTSITALRPWRRGLKKSSQEVASSPASGASDDPDKNLASELPDLTLPTKNTEITRHLWFSSSFFAKFWSMSRERRLYVYEGIWGNWGAWKGRRDGNWAACGAQLRVEAVQGKHYDDMAATGMRVRFCQFPQNWKDQSTDSLEEGPFGSWSDMKMCPRDTYIGRLQIRFEGEQGGGDDTAMNGLAIRCVDKNWKHVEDIVVSYGHWGHWRDWVGYHGMFVKQVRVRNEAYRWGSDSTGLNGIQIIVSP